MDGVFMVLFVGFVTYCYNRRSVSFITPQLIAEGLDSKHAGLILTCQNAAFAASKFLIGLLSDRTEARTLFAAGLLLSGLAAAAFSGCASVPALCACWFANGLAQGCAWPSCAKVIRQRAPPSQFGSLWSTLSAGNNVAGILFPFLAVSIATTHGWRASMLTAGVTSTVVGVCCCFALKSRSATTASSNFKVSDDSKEKPKSKSTVEVSDINLIKLMKDPFLQLVTLGYLVVFISKTTIQDWGKLYLMQECNRTQQDSSVFSSSMETGGFLGRIFAGFFTDFLIRRNFSETEPIRTVNIRMQTAATFTFCVFFLTYAFRITVTESSSLVWISTLGLLVGASLYGPIAIFGIVATESAPKHLSGSSQAVASLAGSVGSIIAGYPVCYIAQKSSWSNVLLLTQFLIGILFLIMIGCRRMEPLWSKKKKD